MFMRRDNIKIIIFDVYFSFLNDNYDFAENEAEN